MSDKILLDTNLWIYLYSKDPIDKYERVNALFLSHIESLIVIRNPLKHDQHVCMHAQQYTLAERSRSRSVAAGVSHNPPDTLRLRSGFGYRIRILQYCVIDRISY